ncbi:MAG: hypothetical protein R3266_00865 [Gemmatimonadota bacterium]|nr:hypothetical protein [Gemmatimonadota bacterium]
MDPISLQTLANWAEIIGGITVVGGVGFAILQIVHIRGRRRDVAAIELARSIQTPEFAGALRRVMSLPIGLSAEEMRRRPGAEEAALLVSLVLESIGLMLHRRVVPLPMVWDLVGGIAPTVWDRLRVWAKDVRREQANPKFEEWTEWLALELRAYGSGLPSVEPSAVGDATLRPIRAG